LPGFWRFGGEPAAYGLNPHTPAPGTYAISASNLQGIKLADHNLYAWFRERTPDAHIGHSILVYRVREGVASDETVVLGVPMDRLADQERALLQRTSSVRQIDPATGWVVPPAAEQAWFIVPDPPEQGQIVRQGPGYVVVRDPSRGIAPGEALARFGPFLAMHSFHIDEVSLTRDKTLTVHVQWGVERAPHRAAVSFAHLLDARGQYAGGWDGMTVPATCWQPGDLIEQEYAIPLSSDLTPGTYQVQVGWYDAATIERWSCYVGGERIGDRFLLPPVEVRP
jgi:hypothetical protein